MKSFLLVRTCLIVVVVASVSLSSHAQLSSSDKKIVDEAQSKYYSLPGHGFTSLKCVVNFDWSTVPLLPSADAASELTTLKHTKYKIEMDIRGHVSVTHTNSVDSPAAIEAAQTNVNLLGSLVTGLFMTWPSKGLNGPIPAFDAQIGKVTRQSRGFDFDLLVPGAPVTVSTDESYLATRIASVHGQIEEHPKYAASREGLVFSANDVTDKTDPNRVTSVHYEIGSSTVNGLTIPYQVRLQVNSNIDVRYELGECQVEKGVVLKVEPPK